MLLPFPEIPESCITWAMAEVYEGADDGIEVYPVLAASRQVYEFIEDRLWTRLIGLFGQKIP
jgi:hypothetical protein